MSTSDITSTDKRDVYSRVTDQIINAIEQDAGTVEDLPAIDAIANTEEDDLEQARRLA
jgi:hypothetical protein